MTTPVKDRIAPKLIQVALGILTEVAYATVIMAAAFIIGWAALLIFR